MKFEVLSGIHSNKEGHHKAGAIVDSDANLDKAFINKFKRRLDLEDGRSSKAVVKGGAQKRGSTVIPQDDRTGNQDLEHDPLTNEELPEQTEGDTEEEDSDTVPAGSKADLNKEEAEDEKPAAKSKKSPLGDDVTKEFSVAKDADLLVFRNAHGKYSVADGDDNGSALNDKALASKSEVNAFIKKYLA